MSYFYKVIVFAFLWLALTGQYLCAQESLDSIAKVQTRIGNEDLDVAFKLGLSFSYSDELRNMAESGNAAAQCLLGSCYADGLGIKADPEQAFYWYSKAAMGNNTKAMNQLGYCYETGLGTETDLVQAFLFYKKAAFRGFSNAYVNLAKCYMMGVGTPVDLLRARAWFEKGAESGIGVAQSNAGYLYFEEGNYEKAFYWLQKACDNGMPYACDFLGDCYENGDGCNPNHQKAVEYYNRSLKLGNTNVSVKLKNQ